MVGVLEIKKWRYNDPQLEIIDVYEKRKVKKVIADLININGI